MIQVQIPKNGLPEVLKIIERETPKPIGSQILIDVHYSGINFADLLARKGLYPDAPPLPCVVGYEVSGIIEAVGKEEDSGLIGKKVVATTRFGGYSSKLLSEKGTYFLLPDDANLTEVAALPVNYITAWQLLVVMGALSSDETILIHNAGGGVGLAAIDIARHIGAQIIGTASAKKHEFLLQHGADHLIDYQTQDWEQEVRRLTNNKGVELIIDPIGGPYWKKNYGLLRPTGRVGFFGISYASTPNSRSGLGLLKILRHYTWFNPPHLMNTNRGTFGVNVGHLWQEGEKLGNWVGHILEGWRDGWIRPRVDKIFPAEKAADAHEFIEERRNIGKVLLDFRNQ